MLESGLERLFFLRAEFLLLSLVGQHDGGVEGGVELLAVPAVAQHVAQSTLINFTTHTRRI
jgi:hypothetical protein